MCFWFWLCLYTFAGFFFFFLSVFFSFLFNLSCSCVLYMGYCAITFHITWTRFTIFRLWRSVIRTVYIFSFCFHTAFSGFQLCYARCKCARKAHDDFLFFFLHENRKNTNTYKNRLRLVNVTVLWIMYENCLRKCIALFQPHINVHAPLAQQSQHKMPSSNSKISKFP